jgi:hypothetical protein
VGCNKGASVVDLRSDGWISAGKRYTATSWLVEQFAIIFCTDILIYSLTLLICRGPVCTAFSY